MLTSDQIRAGRAFVRWSARELAEKAGLSLPTIQRLETADGVPNTSVQTMTAVQTTLEAAGIIFIPGNHDLDEGPGVRLKKAR